jgi:hypothetical protein
MRGLEGKRLLIACGITTLFAVGIISVIILSMSHGADKAQTPSTPVTASGTLACLPHKDTNGPITEECAIGLRTEDGRYYALQQLGTTNAQTPFTKHVTVTGTLDPPTADGLYDTIGTIQVQDFKAN